MFVCSVCAGVCLESAYFVVSMLAAVKTMYLNSTHCKCQWRLFSASMYVVFQQLPKIEHFYSLQSK